MRERHSYREAVADLFKRRPHVWIDGLEIAKVGGAYASRTRISECRTLLGMEIKNRTRKLPSGVVVSEYRYLPTVDLSTATQADLTFGERRNEVS